MFRRLIKFVTVALVGLVIATTAGAQSPIWAVWGLIEVYSNADRSVQFVVHSTSLSGQQHLGGHDLVVEGEGTTRTFTFPSDLPGDSAGHNFLIATQGFADLNVLQPDYIVPNGFFPVSGGTVWVAGHGYGYPAVPTDGRTAFWQDPDFSSWYGTAVATNFAGEQYSFAPAAPPPAPPPPPPSLPPSLPAPAPPPAPPPPPLFESTIPLTEHGLSGSWHQAAKTGQGFEIEIYPFVASLATGYIQLAWFTFDYSVAGGADKQRWYTAGGFVADGGINASLAIFQNTGGNFDAPPMTDARQVGTATLTFGACDRAQFSYTFNDGSRRSGYVPLTRVTPNVTCMKSRDRATRADFALSGNWYDPSTSGQGFFFEVNPDSPVFFLTWYTYAASGQAQGSAGQRWYSGQTSYQAGARTFTMPLYETTGGIFDAVPASTQATVEVGTVTVTFASCSSATLTYRVGADSGAARQGMIALQRAGPAAPGCVD